MDNPSQESLIRLFVETALGGGFLFTWLKLRAERRLRAAQVESEEAGADKTRADAHRADIETMTFVVKSVRENYAEVLRENAEMKERLEQLEELIREIGKAGNGRGRLLGQ